MRRPIAILLCACLITVMVPQAYPQGLQQATTSLPPLLADEWSEQRGPLARSELGLAFLFWKGLAALTLMIPRPMPFPDECALRDCK